MEDNTIIPIFGILLALFTTLGFFVMIVYLRKFTNVERMAAIEKGVSLEHYRPEGSSFFALRLALLLIGAGAGLLMGYMLDNLFDMEEVAYFSMLFVFGGIGLGLS